MPPNLWAISPRRASRLVRRGIWTVWPSFMSRIMGLAYHPSSWRISSGCSTSWMHSVKALVLGWLWSNASLNFITGGFGLSRNLEREPHFTLRFPLQSNLTGESVKHFLALLMPPRFDDPDKSRQAELLNAISLLLLVILSLLVLLNTLKYPDFGRSVNSVLVMLIVFQLVTQILIRNGYVFFAGLSLLFLSWVGITWFAWRADGVRDIALFAYFTIL